MRERGEKREKERWSEGRERETNRDRMIEQIKNGKIFFRAGKERKIAVKEHVEKVTFNGDCDGE